tara:strand:- start:1361 stop:2029 length:669 start_codon:yes stop_codon:yes gene_type:complete
MKSMQRNLKNFLDNKKLFIFDFDGVIADSVEVKDLAFRSLYQIYGKEIIEKVSKYHLANGGISRYEKIKFFHNEFLNKKISEKELNKLSRKFSENVVDEVIASEEIYGSTEYLLKLAAKKKICAINTGTPTDEIIEILKKRELFSLFKYIFGSPDNKLENLRKILFYSDVNISETVFFGDSSTDLQAAMELDIDFIGVGKAIIETNTTYEKINYLSDFSELL